MRNRWICFICAGALVSCSAVLRAQETAPAPPDPLMAQAGGPGEGPGSGPFGERIELLGFEGMHPGRVVKGAPFSATGTTETTQALQDGTKIHRTTTSQLYRDGEGRVRHEVSFSGFGPLQASGKTRNVIMINDPVAGAHFLLNPDEKVAHKMPFRGGKSGAALEKEFHGKGPGRHEDTANTTTESLGTQNIDGVNAEGTRITRMIPAGQIGNDQPIKVVFERWYSPELQMVVKSARSDPRFGTTTYTLTNIQRTDPNPSLFSVPSDYTVKERGPRNRLKRFRGAPPSGGSEDAPPPPPGF